MIEKEKMLKGFPYDASDKEIRKLFFLCKDKIEKYNKTSYKQPKLREKTLRKLFNSVGENIYIEPFFYCDYGMNIFIGDNITIGAESVVTKKILANTTVAGSNKSFKENLK